MNNKERQSIYLKALISLPQLQEPAHYNFGYGVASDVTGTYFGHVENRQGHDTHGKYFVDLPDGRRMIVSYYADHTGYHPTVTYEPRPTTIVPFVPSLHHHHNVDPNHQPPSQHHRPQQTPFHVQVPYAPIIPSYEPYPYVPDSYFNGNNFHYNLNPGIIPHQGSIPHQGVGLPTVGSDAPTGTFLGVNPNQNVGSFFPTNRPFVPNGSPSSTNDFNNVNTVNHNEVDRRPISTFNQGFNTNNGVYNLGWIPSSGPHTINPGSVYQPTSTSNSPTAFIVHQGQNGGSNTIETGEQDFPFHAETLVSSLLSDREDSKPISDDSAKENNHEKRSSSNQNDGWHEDSEHSTQTSIEQHLNSREEGPNRRDNRPEQTSSQESASISNLRPVFGITSQRKYKTKSEDTAVSEQPLDKIHKIEQREDSSHTLDAHLPIVNKVIDIINSGTAAR